MTEVSFALDETRVAHELCIVDPDAATTDRGPIPYQVTMASKLQTQSSWQVNNST